MDNYYYNATHEEFRAMIGYTYVFPIIDAWHHANICNGAVNLGYKVVAILHDGVVYRNIPETE